MHAIANKTMRRGLILVFALALIATAGLAVGLYTYQVPWVSIDGGGGKVQGGVFALTGTIGQADAGTLSGGAFTLQGGFEQPDSAWPKNAVSGPWWLY